MMHFIQVVLLQIDTTVMGEKEIALLPSIIKKLITNNVHVVNINDNIELRLCLMKIILF